jgi:hypothetical protein
LFADFPAILRILSLFIMFPSYKFCRFKCEIDAIDFACPQGRLMTVS